MPNKTIPGFFIQYKDGGLVAPSLAPTTDSILIMGNALDGPINTPYPVSTIQDAQTIFGPLIYSGDYINPYTGVADGYPTYNSLIKGMHEVLLGGAGNIILCRVGGQTAVASGIINATGNNQCITVFARYPGRIYNGTVVSVATGSTQTTFNITQTATKGGNLSYIFNNTELLINVVNVINNDLANGTVKLSLQSNYYNVGASSLLPATGTLLGGTNGTSAPGEDYFGTVKFGYYNALTDPTTGTFIALQDYPFDIAVLTGIYADDCVTSTTGAANATTKSVAQDFANFLATISENNYPCFGMLGLRPTQLTNVVDLTNFVNNNYLSTAAGWQDQNSGWIKFGYFMNNGFLVADANTGQLVDQGRYLNIPAGPDLVIAQKDLNLYIENGYAVYAGLVSSQAAKDAATRQPLGSVSSLSGQFSKAIHIALNAGVGNNPITRNLGGGAYVTFKEFIDLPNPGVIQDNTCSRRGSDYQRLQILRICNLATHLVRAAVLPFIGKGLDINARTSMRTQISSALNTLANAGALLGGEGTGFTFNISSDPTQTIAGEITISLTLRPSIELRFINIIVNVTE